MDYPSSQIIYIYFIYAGRRLIYIGRSTNPINRLNNHRLGILRDFEVNKFKAIIYGPYEKWTGHIIESYEIIKRLKYKHFLGTINNNYGHNQKISVKDYGQKTIFFFEKESRIKEMVSKYTN